MRKVPEHLSVISQQKSSERFCTSVTAQPVDSHAAQPALLPLELFHVARSAWRRAHFTTKDDKFHFRLGIKKHLRH